MGDGRPITFPAGCPFQRRVRRERLRLTVLISTFGKLHRVLGAKTMRFSGNHRSVVTLFVSKLALCERVTTLNIIEVYILRKNMFFIAFVEINFFITP